MGIPKSPGKGWRPGKGQLCGPLPRRTQTAVFPRTDALGEHTGEHTGQSPTDHSVEHGDSQDPESTSQAALLVFLLILECRVTGLWTTSSGEGTGLRALVPSPPAGDALHWGSPEGLPLPACPRLSWAPFLPSLQAPGPGNHSGHTSDDPG